MKKIKQHLISIVDVSGRVVKTYSPIKTNRLIIEKRNLAFGLYFVRIQNKNSKKEMTLMVD